MSTPRGRRRWAFGGSKPIRGMTTDIATPRKRGIGRLQTTGIRYRPETSVAHRECGKSAGCRS